MHFVPFWRRNPHERTGFQLYSAAVAAARDPYLYTEIGVPDTLNGRFDCIGLHAFLLIRRLEELPTPGEHLAQAVFDAMFSDMDVNLREMGVGDLVVGKRVRRMWEAFHGRARAYEAALEKADTAGLAAALTRNVWTGSPAAGAEVLARLALAQWRCLARQELPGFFAGRVAFLSAAEAAQ